MDPVVEQSASSSPVFPYRRIGPDDVLSLAEVYPRDELPLTLLSGTVLPSGTHVYAVRKDGIPVRETITDSTGRYTMNLDPGAYTILAEGSDRASDPILLEPGTLRDGMDLNVPAEATTKLDWISVVDAQGAFAGVPRISLARGGVYRILINRTPFDGQPAIQFSAPSVQLAGEPQVISSIPNLPGLVLQRISVPADVPLGAYNITYSNGSASAVLPGAVRITVNPRDCTLKTTETPGVFIIGGADLAEFEQTAPEQGATQLGGVGVRADERFLPMLAASPAEIRFLAPPDFTPPSDVCKLIIYQ
jgi:hypothetical protein